MGFYMWIFIVVLVIGVVFVYLLMSHFTRALKLFLEAIATFIDIIGMHNENQERLRQGEGVAHQREAFTREASRLRKLMNVSIFP